MVKAPRRMCRAALSRTLTSPDIPGAGMNPVAALTPFHPDRRRSPRVLLVGLLLLSVGACGELGDPTGGGDPVSENPAGPLLSGGHPTASLVCSPASVGFRGYSTCQISEAKEVVEWGFTPDDPAWQLPIARGVDVGDALWSGEFVMSGTVWARVTKAEDPLEAHVTVAPRTGSALSANASSHGRVQSLESCIQGTTVASVMSRFCPAMESKLILLSIASSPIQWDDLFTLEDFLARFQLGQILDQGPNHETLFWDGPSLELRIAWAMHTRYTPGDTLTYPSTGLPSTCAPSGDWRIYTVNDSATGCAPLQSFQAFKTYVAEHEVKHLDAAIASLTMQGVPDLLQDLRNLRAPDEQTMFWIFTTRVVSENQRITCEAEKTHTGTNQFFEMRRPNPNWQLDTVEVREDVSTDPCI
jgi:hypothetical protein